MNFAVISGTITHSLLYLQDLRKNVSYFNSEPDRIYPNILNSQAIPRLLHLRYSRRRFYRSWYGGERGGSRLDRGSNRIRNDETDGLISTVE